MKGDGLFFIGIIIFIFIVWVATGGPSRPISFAGPYITPITDVGTVQQGYGDTGTANSRSVWAEITDIDEGLANLQRGASDLRAYGVASPYEGSVQIVGYGGASATDPDEEYITLSVSGDESVLISGWSLVSSASGYGARIPGGSELPRAGSINELGPIILAPGEEAIVVSGSSPIGISFKENMCTGYFAERQTFVPSLGMRCPTAYDEFDRYYPGNELADDSCYARMRETNTCEVPSTSRVSNECRALIDQYLHYNGCVATHRYEARFAGDTWRVYLGERRELWKQSRDAIKLLDAEGRTVDLYTY